MPRNRKLTPADVLVEIEKLASFLFTPTEIGLVIDQVDFDERMEDDESPEYRAYQRGKLKAKLELHKNVLGLAKQGSGPAQSLALRMLANQDAHDA